MSFVSVIGERWVDEITKPKGIIIRTEEPISNSSLLTPFVKQWIKAITTQAQFIYPKQLVLPLFLLDTLQIAPLCQDI